MDIHIHIYIHGWPWNIPGTLLLLEIPNVPKGRSMDHHGALSVHWEVTRAFTLAKAN